jgi:hypothetical protein
MQVDTDFQEEFNRIMNDLSVPEADKDFTRDFFDDTDLNTELAIPRDASGPEYARAATRLREKMDCQDTRWFTDGAAFRESLAEISGGAPIRVSMAEIPDGAAIRVRWIADWRSQ